MNSKMEKNQLNVPIRILQVVTIMNLGGIESMLMTIYRNIDRSKIQFDFIVHRSERGIFDDEIEALGGRIFRFPALSLKNYKNYIHQLKQFFTTADYPYQVIHSHINTNSYNILKVAKEFGIHTRIAHAHIDSVSGSFVKKMLKKIQKPLLKHVTTDYFACSRNAADYLYGKNVSATLINNAIDTELYKFEESKRQSIRAELGMADKQVYGHIGRFNAQKNHLFLLEIFKEILRHQPQALLILVGDGELRSVIENKIKELHLDANVRLLGLRKDVSFILSALDAFIFPSLYEGLSVATVEAQCAGLPMFVSDTISKESFITDHIYSLPLNDTPDKWADFILKKMSMNVDRANSYKTIIEKGYDIKNNVSILEKLYLEKNARKDL